MNNRNPNKENTYSNLAKWCEQYHKDSGIKIHPSSVPVEMILEDVLGYVALMMSRISGLASALDHSNERVAQLEKDVLDCNVKILALENPVVETVAVRGEDIPVSDFVKPNKKKENKK